MNKRDTAVIEAVKKAQASEFGLTGVKVELEIKFNRHRCPAPQVGCDNCTNEGTVECNCCDGAGDHICEFCEMGVYEGEECSDCHGDFEYDCDDCDSTGMVACFACGGEPPEVEGDQPTNWEDLALINDKVLERLKPLGLARKLRVNETYTAGGLRVLAHKYRPVSPLVFSKVYNDGTVDTEMTFTLLLDKPENALLLPKFVEAFYDLKNEIGQETDVSHAGMHMTFLNNRDGVYPYMPTDDHIARFKNFKRSMILLMPALFFLASSSETSRGLSYRVPRVSDSDKYSAIAYRGGGLEFRAFETCYDQPEAILDYLVVMCNCLKYWTLSYTRNNLARVANNVRFGLDNNSNKLERMFVTIEHISLLDRGLNLIKPSYYTISELKRQRNFTITLDHVKDRDKRIQQEAEKQYKIYEQRLGWENVMRRNSFIADYIQSNVLRSQDSYLSQDEAVVMKKAEDYATSRINARPKKEFASWFVEKKDEISKEGDWSLCAE